MISNTASPSGSISCIRSVQTIWTVFLLMIKINIVMIRISINTSIDAKARGAYFEPNRSSNPR